MPTARTKSRSTLMISTEEGEFLAKLIRQVDPLTTLEIGLAYGPVANPLTPEPQK